MKATLAQSGISSATRRIAGSTNNANVASKILGSTRGMAKGKEIRFGVEGRAAMLRGVDLLADAVQVRLNLMLDAIVNFFVHCLWLAHSRT